MSNEPLKPLWILGFSGNRRGFWLLDFTHGNIPNDPRHQQKSPATARLHACLTGQSNNQQHRRPRLRQTHHQHLGGVLIAHVQIHPFFQRNPADGLGLDLGQLGPVVSLDGGNQFNLSVSSAGMGNISSMGCGQSESASTHMNLQMINHELCKLHILNC